MNHPNPFRVLIFALLLITAGCFGAATVDDADAADESSVGQNHPPLVEAYILPDFRALPSAERYDAAGNITSIEIPLVYSAYAVDGSIF